MKKLGIIGGLGPMATAYFLQSITQMVAVGRGLVRQGTEVMEDENEKRYCDFNGIRNALGIRMWEQ